LCELGGIDCMREGYVLVLYSLFVLLIFLYCNLDESMQCQLLLVICIAFQVWDCTDLVSFHEMMNVCTSRVGLASSGTGARPTPSLTSERLPTSQEKLICYTFPLSTVICCSYSIFSDSIFACIFLSTTSIKTRTYFLFS
jgi:hypothetical protein